MHCRTPKHVFMIDVGFLFDDSKGNLKTLNVSCLYSVWVVLPALTKISPCQNDHSLRHTKGLMRLKTRLVRYHEQSKKRQVIQGGSVFTVFANSVDIQVQIKPSREFSRKQIVNHLVLRTNEKSAKRNGLNIYLAILHKMLGSYVPKFGRAH